MEKTVDVCSAMTAEVIAAITNINPVTQRLNLGSVLAELICQNKNVSIPVAEKHECHIPKIANHAELEGTVNTAALKAAYNSLIRDLISCGLMEEASTEK